MRKKVVSIIGGHKCNKEVEQLAHNLGKKLAKVVDILVCGGLSGVMEASAKGFKAEGGLTIGILPSYNKNDANSFIDIAIPTGLGLARNVLVVKSADIVIALPGESGTLSEIAYSLQFGIAVIGLGSWDIPGVIKADNVDEAITKAKAILSRQNKNIQIRKLDYEKNSSDFQGKRHA
ncbi:MAG: TIGR00725 family protein [Candidatus Omnitrophica bacterium]|nr:TIGR00725 family protein [Candidatus Omnitrophota bacterium]